MTAEFFGMFGIFIWWTAALDAVTREIASFDISVPQTASEAKVALPKLEISGSGPGRRLEVDKFRLDVWIVPDPDLTSGHG